MDPGYSGVVDNRHPFPGPLSLRGTLTLGAGTEETTVWYTTAPPLAAYQ